MGVQDNFWTIGNEAVSWGTKAATLTRGIENKTDDVTPSVEYLESRGMRPGTVGTPTGRKVAVQRGGAINLDLDLIASSLGLVLASIGSSVATTTPGGATLSRLHTITPTTTGVTRSETIHAGRADVSGTVHHHDYLGCMAESLALSLQPKGLPSVKTSYQYRTVDTAAASVTPSYPTAPYVYTDVDCTVTIDSTVKCQRQFDVTIPTGLDFDRWRICPNGREKPLLMDRVEPTGNLSIDYDGDDWHNDFLEGTELENLVIYFEGPEIETGFNYFCRFTFPLIQLTGSSPKVAIGATPEQPIPFRVLDNLTDPLWKIEYQNADTAV